MQLRKFDERLKIEKIKWIYAISIVQNIFIAGEMLYQSKSTHVPLRSVLTIHNPMAVCFMIYVIPTLILTIVYGIKNSDENRSKQNVIVLSSVIATVIFGLLVFIVDGSITIQTGIAILIFGAFMFIFSELINFLKQKEE